MVNPATARPEQPCKRPPLRGMLAIRTERSPHVLIHMPGTAASSRSANVITLRSKTTNMTPSRSMLARTRRVRRRPV